MNRTCRIFLLAIEKKGDRVFAERPDLDAIVFPDAYKRTKTIVSSNPPILIAGTVEPFLNAEKGELLI